MSAFICSYKTIAHAAAIVFNVLQGKEDESLSEVDLSVFNGKTFGEIFAMLNAYNVESVNYLYGECTSTGLEEGVADKYQPEDMLVRLSMEKAIAAYGAMRCWLYQSSEKTTEHPIYRTVANMSENLRKNLIGLSVSEIYDNETYHSIISSNWYSRCREELKKC